MNKYSVLWLDDDFQPLIENPNEDQEDINDVRETFIGDVKKAGLYNLEITGVTNIEQFKEKLLEPGRYQAVIFDLKGLDNDNIDNDYGITEGLDAIRDLTLLRYVYSNTLTSEVFKHDIQKLKEAGCCFDKGLSCKPLYEKILKDLDQKYNLYQNYPQLLALFQEGYLSINDKMRVDQLLQDYHSNNTATDNKLYIRDLLHGLYETLVYSEIKGKKQLIDNQRLPSDEGRFGVLFKALSYGASDVLPNSNMIPRPIKNAIQYTGNIANLLSHGKKLGNAESFDKPFYSTMMLGVYPTVIEILLWYYDYMTK